MPRSRSRSRSRQLRRETVSLSQHDSRSRSQSWRDTQSRTRSRRFHRSRSRDSDRKQQMQTIINRISELEKRPVPAPPPSLPAFSGQLSVSGPLLLEPEGVPTTAPESPARPPRGSVDNPILTATGSSSGVVPHSRSVTSTPDQVSSNIIENALRSLQSAVKSNQSYYISNFDPHLHDINAWCLEVDRAKLTNNWSDSECLSRIGNCLKGDARLWLNEWVTSDRSWTNFKKEFIPLCPRQPNVANILYDTMKTDSDHFATYADYARRSLLRLRIVNGLSDELITLIIIRGITDPQIRAAATNAKLKSSDLVDFLSIYVKPSTSKSNHFGTFKHTKCTQNIPKGKINLETTRKRRYEDGRCFSCGLYGHLRASCKKRRIDNKDRVQTEPSSTASSSTPANNKLDPCTFCKKPGHKAETCFAKIKSESRNRNVNFCREMKRGCRTDIVVAVIQGVPVDVLIDSGSTISLVSSSLLKYFNSPRRPSFRVLKGLGSQEIESTCYITVPIEFNDVTLEVDLFVVTSEFMNAPVIVGTDVLNREGVTYIRTRDRQCITRKGCSTSSNVLSIVSDITQLNTTLTGNDLDKLRAIIRDFAENFIAGTATSTVKTGHMSIKLTSNTPINYRPYRLSQAEMERVRDIVNDLKDKNIIRESESQYASPILLVKKKDGTDRMCVDFRKLNQVTVKDRFPLPRIDDCMDRLGRHKYFTSLDMATGFHQIPMEDLSVPLTAFVTPEGHYEYLKMPYGLTNAPIVYQRIISRTLRRFLESGKVLVYIDDVLILSNSINEGFEILRDVLRTLTEAGFSLNLKKCSFLMTKINYLGRTISQGQVQPSLEKVKALAEAPVPKNVKQVRQFLGLASYFRKYIAGFASKVACIARLTRKDVPFNWGTEHETARLEIIDYLTSEPILAVYDPALPIEVHTDASAIGYGAVLLQIHNSKNKRVVAYFSKLTQGAESNYHSYELETLAVVRALQHFRHYLIGVHFTVITDCNSLKLTQKKRDLMPRVARWWVYLQDFNFSLVYRKGTSLAHADYLSRNPVNLITIQKPQNWAQIAQAADEETQSLIQRLKDGNLDSNQYVVKNDLLYYKYSPVGEQSRLLCFIPKGHRLSLLRVFHDEHEHNGIDKTIDLILKHFWFPSLRVFVKKYVSHCIVCISHKKAPRASLQPIHSWQKPDVPFDTVHADVLGPLPESNGNRYVLIIIDAFSKFCLLYAMTRQDTTELKRHFSHAVSLFGTPKLIIADRGRMFQSREFLGWLTEIGSDIHLITPEMHQSNGQAERYCRTLLNMVRIQSNYLQAEWSSILWKLQLTLNITKQKTTQCSPLSLLIGIDAATPLIRNLIRDVAVGDSHPNREALREIARQRVSDRLKQNQEQQDSYVNRNRKPPHAFETNSLVFVIKKAQSTGKLDSGMRGPYRVVRSLPHGRYELQLVSGSYGKCTQAAAEYMVPWKGEWTPDTCIAYFESQTDPESAATDQPCVDYPNDQLEPRAGTSSSEAHNTGVHTDSATLDNEDVLISGKAVLE